METDDGGGGDPLEASCGTISCEIQIDGVHFILIIRDIMISFKDKHRDKVKDKEKDIAMHCELSSDLVI